jgi:hypothetical protein
MEYLIPLLIFLFILLVFVTLVGHGIWVALVWFFRELSGAQPGPRVQTPPLATQATHYCPHCRQALTMQMKFCGVCGAERLTLRQEEELRELEVTLRQIERLRAIGELEAEARVIGSRIEAERERILFPNGRVKTAPKPTSQKSAPSESQIEPAATQKAPGGPFITPVVFEEMPRESAPHFESWSKESDTSALPPPVLKPPRKPFTDVLAAFMEQSNVRWGEIIGGLLIIGCSTALVISLWAQISRVPVMKFLIFTTVTAALFGIGFYTEHHWKLPTTSRGILTIATLLVPLNFLAIAAVSTNTTPGVLVISSEIISPAIFLCLVYFAGRVITSKWPYLLAAGALGSSVGQLLIRHFVVPEISTNWFVLLGAFPIICYVAATGWMLKIALADGEIDETEATEIFTTLGALTFAAILPIGLVLYKSASTAVAITHLAPLVSLAGMPTLATGMLLWRRAVKKELRATRTAGLSIAIFGMVFALSGMLLAWPNPASVIPAAAFNFVLFTSVAVFIDEPRAHVIAAGCLTFAYVVGFHVWLGHVPWQNPGEISLLRVTLSAKTGQALSIPFVAFVLVHEWLRSKRERDAVSYLIAASGVAAASLGFLFVFALGVPNDPFHVSVIMALYAAGAFWLAWRRRVVGFTWAGAVLLFVAVAQASHSLLSLRFPWQASALFFALGCVAGGLAARSLHREETERLFVAPLQLSATIGCLGAASVLAVELFWFAAEPAAVFATRAFILAGVLFGLLWLSRSSFFFVSFQVGLALGGMLTIAALNGSMSSIVAITSLQLDAIAAASAALIWASTRKIWKPDELPVGLERRLSICERWIALSFVTLFIVPVALRLIALPDRPSATILTAGRFTGWLAVLLTIAAVLAVDKLCRKPLKVSALSAALLAIASLSAFAGAHVSVAQWTELHILSSGLVVSAWLILVSRDLPPKQVISILGSRSGILFDDDWASDSEFFAGLIGMIALPVALRAPFSDPAGAWWSIGALLIMAVFAAALNWITFRRGYVYVAGILGNVAVSIWLSKYQRQPVSSLSAFVEANVIALSLPGIVWLLLELRTRRVKLAAKSTSAAAFHNVAALASMLAMAAIVISRVYDDLYGFNQTLFPLLDLFGLGSLAALLIACLWDSEAKYSIACFYVVGLFCSATFLHHQQLTPRNFVWLLVIAAAVQSVLAALMWRLRRPLIAFAGQLKIPPRIKEETDSLAWLLILNGVAALAIAVTTFWIEIVYDELSLRALASVAVISQVLTFGLMAEGKRRLSLQRAAVAALLAGLVFAGWSMLTPGVTGTWLNRAVILMTLMLVSVALFGLGLDKLIERKPDWTRAFRDCVPAMTVTGIVALAFILCAEVYYQIEFGVVRVRLLALLTVALTLAAASVVCIFFALSPKHDPLALPDRWRGSYVYAAEVCVVLLFMHIRLTMPWLFHGFFERYWPLVVLIIAYVGVAISEFFKRREVHVLATPIERTGAFLPLLPVIGFWIAQSQVEYSTLLFVVGGLYGLLAILRRSFWFGLAAALAGNGGLWYLLHETSEYQFYQHPQLWLIPAAVSVLIAAHLNRKDFSESQMTAVRYLCLTTIYASSTADIFINGVASSPWLPFILAALSVAGVFAGMIFRIRAFLLLGSIFLLLAIVTMIKFASVNFGWTWLWYVAGIATGAAIIATFAVFEKKRADVLRMVDGLKDWKG